MKIEKLLYKSKNVHFSGICGISMSGIAKHLQSKGYNVSGSDTGLKRGQIEHNFENIKLYDKHSQTNLKDVDTLIYTSAIDDNNTELVYAKQNQITLIKRSQVLGEILSEYKNSIAISGSHGKTTATALLSNVFISAGLDPTIFLGGFDKNFGNYRLGKSDFAIAEACEYRKNLLDLNTKVVVVLNIDNDHLDSYTDMQEMVETFDNFAKNSIAIINADDKGCQKLESLTSISFGINNLSNYMAKNVDFNGKGYSFDVIAYGIKLGRINLKINGYHNIYNVLSTIAVSQLYHIPFSTQKEAIERFSGVKRRNEYLGKFCGIDIIADYAHHPKEISAMFKTFDSLNKRYLTVFQPHTYSRTKLLMNDFISCFNNDKPLIIYKTYPARESFDRRGSAKAIFTNLLKINKKGVFYSSSKQGVENIIKSQEKTIEFALFLGAGDIYEVAKEMVKKTKKMKKRKKITKS